MQDFAVTLDYRRDCFTWCLEAAVALFQHKVVIQVLESLLWSIPLGINHIVLE